MQLASDVGGQLPFAGSDIAAQRRAPRYPKTRHGNETLRHRIACMLQDACSKGCRALSDVFSAAVTHITGSHTVIYNLAVAGELEFIFKTCMCAAIDRS